jgi:hypothetical protein
MLLIASNEGSGVSKIHCYCLYGEEHTKTFNHIWTRSVLPGVNVISLCFLIKSASFLPPTF